MPTADPELSAILARLRRVSAATIATELFKRGLRHQVMEQVRPFSQVVGFAGPAFTMRQIPAREDLETLESLRRPGNLQWDAVERIEPGSVLVIDSRGDTTAGSGGLLLLTRMLRRGVAAAVTDGAFRDTPDAARIGLPMYAAGMTAATRLSRFHVADLDVPIGCGNVPVYPGDVIVGDAESVVVIPRALADEVSRTAEERERLESYLHGRIDRGEPLAGLYPPGDRALAEYRAWVDSQDPADGGRDG